MASGDDAAAVVDAAADDAVRGIVGRRDYSQLQQQKRWHGAKALNLRRFFRYGLEGAL